MKSLGKVINPSGNTNPFNHNTLYMKLYTSLKDGTNNKDEYGQLIKTQYLDEVFNIDTFKLSRLIRKVSVTQSKFEDLAMREVEVFNMQENVALGKTATQSSTYKDLSPGKALDGNFLTLSHTTDHTYKGFDWGKCQISATIFPECLAHTLTFSFLFVQDIAETNAKKDTQMQTKKIYAKALINIMENIMEVAVTRKATIS